MLNERRDRISFSDCVAFLRELNQLQIHIVPLGDSGGIIELARRHSLSVYDSAYLALAINERLPLASLDRSLQAAARTEGVRLLA